MVFRKIVFVCDSVDCGQVVEVDQFETTEMARIYMADVMGWEFAGSRDTCDRCQRQPGAAVKAAERLINPNLP